MVSITENITRYLDIAEMTYRIPRRWIAAIVIFPIFIDLVALILLRIEATRYAARWMLAENHPAELLTFLFLMIAAGAALEISRQAMRTQENVWVYGFYLMFGVGLFLIAMEEISWGQQFLKFETFGVFKEINMQHEVNIHNIGALQGNSAYFRIIYGFGGVIGVLLATLNIWRKITP
ncbi:MAG: hypothetical protein LJE83_15370, partial [Gammaproteobacteria bacterium]|nr:hypothetical protein [Gammaproteobacteria bacterium]